MKQIKKFSAIIFSVVALAACNKEITTPEEPATVTPKADIAEEDLTDRNGAGNNQGHLYTLSNQTGGNKVLDYKIAANGTLTLVGEYAAGGNGTGGGLGNQGAVIITGDDEVLLAVNPGSNSISSFKITGNGLNLKSTVSSGGMLPVSVTEHDGTVYVLNAGGMGNISGFKLGSNDKLTPIAGSTRPLSSSAAGAAQVSFVRNGRVLVVTEKATNKIITYRVNEWGVPGAMHSITSSNPTPFGFAPGRFGNIYVSEAVGGAPGASTVSSYQVSFNGNITLTDGPVSAGQSAACWVVLTGDGKYAYATNTASNNISSFGVQPYTGNLSVVESIAATTQMGPIDAAISRNSKYLYVLNAGSHSIGTYAVANNGSLTSVQNLPGVPAGATGLAAR
jgi:6-phosphogluconolactonase